MGLLPVSHYKYLFLYCRGGTPNSLESCPLLMLARKGHRDHEGTGLIDAPTPERKGAEVLRLQCDVSGLVVYEHFLHFIKCYI